MIRWKKLPQELEEVEELKLTKQESKELDNGKENSK